MRWQGNIIIKDWMSKKKNNIEFGLHDRAIFVWPWNKKTRTKQKQQTNRNRVIWFVYRTRHKLAWLLVGWANARVKKRHARELSRNQTILRFDVILQHDWPIEQFLLFIRVFFGGKTKSPCFDLFIHWLIKQITNTCWNHFSRSFENRSMKILFKTRMIAEASSKPLLANLKILDVFSIYSLQVSSFIYLYHHDTLPIAWYSNLSNWKSDSSIFNKILWLLPTSYL